MAFNTYAAYRKSVAKGGKKPLTEPDWLKRKTPDPTRPLTAAQIKKQANVQGAAMVQPELDALNIQRNRDAELYNAQVASERGANTAMFDQLQGLAPRVYGNYENAAGALSGLAKGFGEGAQTAASNQADEWEALLAQAGQLQGKGVVRQATAPQGIDDVIYGEGGYLPAQDMLREGAAFGALAELQPGFETGRSGQRTQQYGADYRGTRQELADKEVALRGRIGGERAKAREAIMANELQKYGARLTAKELGAKIEQEKVDSSIDLIESQADAAAEGVDIDRDQSVVTGVVSNAQGKPILYNGKTKKTPKAWKGGSSSADQPGGLSPTSRQSKINTAKEAIEQIIGDGKGKPGETNALTGQVEPGIPRSSYEDLMEQSLARIHLPFLSATKRRQTVDAMLRANGFRPAGEGLAVANSWDAMTAGGNKQQAQASASAAVQGLLSQPLTKKALVARIMEEVGDELAASGMNQNQIAAWIRRITRGK